MKSLRLLACFVAVAGILFFSCTDSDPVSAQPQTQESIALRTALSEIKKQENISGRSVNPLCFDFAYPITLSFNNGASVTVSSYEGLIALLEEESPELFLAGIAYPFQVQQEGIVVTVTSEAGFQALLEDCGYTGFDDEIENSYCFDVVFPVSVVTANGTFEINSQAELITYLNGSATGGIQLVFPISVLQSGQVITVNNIYEMFEIIESCDDCICTLEYAPVCVNTPAGVMEFGNACHALCSGYTQNDFVSCNPTTPCSITNLTTTPGECSATGLSYQLTIDFDYADTTETQFTVFSSTSVSVGTFNLSALPITIDYPMGSETAEYISVVIGTTVNGCSAVQQYAVPDCNPNQPATFGELLISGCFSMVYPLQVQWQGALITVQNDGQLLQYYNPTPTTYFPPFNYPVSIVYNGVTMIITSDAGFAAAIENMDCN